MMLIFSGRIAHHYTQTNSNIINKTRALPQTREQQKHIS